MNIPNQEQINEVVDMLTSAITQLINRDSDIFNIELIEPKRISPDAKILNRELFETTINHRLAYYVERFMDGKESFVGYHVDIEYNRYYADRKQVNTVEGALEARPDILVHSRINHNHPMQHYLIIEAKKGDITEHDLNKIRGFIEDQRYSYLFGFAVSYCSDDANVRGTLYYFDGNIIQAVPIVVSKQA